MKNYLRENPGAGLMAVFQGILITVIVLVLFGNLGLANELATYGYYILLVGIIAQLGVVLRAERRKSVEHDHPGD